MSSSAEDTPASFFRRALQTSFALVVVVMEEEKEKKYNEAVSFRGLARPRSLRQVNIGRLLLRVLEKLQLKVATISILT